ncbi:MAG TPA: hypothetical protein VHB21_11310, partial [Minicystis sp.]|nr:hypothetical protein [Minicystis sp.]
MSTSPRELAALAALALLAASCGGADPKPATPAGDPPPGGADAAPAAANGSRAAPGKRMDARAA